MAEIVVRVINQSSTPIKDVKIEFDWVVLGIPQHVEKITDNFGEVKMDNGASSADIVIKATKYPYATSGRVAVGPFGFGVTPPNPQILTLKFNPTAPISNTIDRIGQTLDTNSKWVIVAVGIPFGIAAAYFIYKWVSTGQFIGTAAKTGSAIKGAVGKK